MKRYFNTLLDMFNRVISFANDPGNSAITNSVPNLQQGINTTLTSQVNAINALIYPGSEVNTGYATQKRLIKKSASDLAFIVISGGKAYAKTNNNDPLFDAINLSATEIFNFPDNEFASKVNGLMNKLTPYQNDLIPYGVQPQAFNDVTSVINLYTSLNSIPLNKKAAKKVINDAIENLFKDTNDFVRTVLDSIVVTLKTPQPIYYNTYRAVRKHQPHGLRHNRINATVVDELGEPFVGVQVTVDEYTDPDTGKTYHAVTGNTDINGMVTVEDFWPGNRMVTVSGPGIITKQFGPFQFEEGRAITQTFILQPDFTNLPSPEQEKEKANK